MTKIRRGGYIFYAWIGDHAPRHVHVLRDDDLVAKWDLESWKIISGHPPRRLVSILEQLREEGRL